MKLTDVPEDFRSKYVLSPEQAKAMRVAYIVPSTNDCNGHQMPQMALNVKGLYDVDVVKLKHPTTGEEFIVRRTEVMTKSGQDIIYEWETHEFRKEIDQVGHTTDMNEAAKILNLPPGGAVAAKLYKAHRLGIPTPEWFQHG